MQGADAWEFSRQESQGKLVAEAPIHSYTTLHGGDGMGLTTQGGCAVLQGLAHGQENTCEEEEKKIGESLASSQLLRLQGWVLLKGRRLIVLQSGRQAGVAT